MKYLIPFVLLVFVFIQILSINRQVHPDETCSHSEGAGISFKQKHSDLSTGNIFTPSTIKDLRTFRNAILAGLEHERSNGLFYFASSYLFMKFFGPTHITGRAFSILLAIVCLWLFYLITLEFELSSRDRLIAFTLLAFNPVFFLYAGMMRQYILALTLILLDTWLIMTCLRLNLNKFYSMSLSLLIFLVTMAALLTHYFTMVALGLILVFLTLHLARHKVHNKKHAHAIASMTLAFIGSVIIVSIISNQTSYLADFGKQDYWTQVANGEIGHHTYDYGMVRQPTPYWLAVLLSRATLMLVGIDLLFVEIVSDTIGVSIVFFPLLLVYIYELIKDRDSASIVSQWVNPIRWIPIVWLFFISILSLKNGNTVPFYERYGLLVTPFAIIAVFTLARDKNNKRQPTLKWIAIIAFVAGTTLSVIPRVLGRHIAYGKSGETYKYSAAASFIAANYEEKDTVVFSNQQLAMMSSLYLDERTDILMMVDSQGSYSELRVSVIKPDTVLNYYGGSMSNYN